MKKIKHLPQIKFDVSEKDIEQYLYYNSEKFLGLNRVAQQFKTNFGIVDLIFRHPIEKNIYFVCELKKEQLDCHAYCQVIRYSQYLNANFSKDGERTFIPLLIGKNLSGELNQIVYLFDKEYLTNPHIVRYALFGFDVFSGLSFDFYVKKQIEFEEEIKSCGWIDAMIEKMDFLEYEKYRMKEHIKENIVGNED